MIQHLLQLLDIALRQRDDARDQLQRLQNSLLPTIQAENSLTILQVLPNRLPLQIPETNTKESNSRTSCTCPHWYEYFAADRLSYQGFSNPCVADSRNVQPRRQPFQTGMHLSSEDEIIDRASAAIDSVLVRGKPLPPKGKLLQTVLEAGPLLQTFLVKPPLPRWRNPPPLLTMKRPFDFMEEINSPVRGPSSSSFDAISHGSPHTPSASSSSNVAGTPSPGLNSHYPLTYLY